MKYMVVERFKPGAIRSVYERFDNQGRLMPDDLHFIDSWISSDLTTCYQLMECEDETLFARWIDNWKDLVDFDVVPVMSSAEARAAVKETE